LGEGKDSLQEENKENQSKGTRKKRGGDLRQAKGVLFSKVKGNG